MYRYENILKFFKKKHLNYLLENNISIVDFQIGKPVSFLIEANELYVFEGHRAINQALSHNNGDVDKCLEGVEYFKITKDFLDELKEDDINVQTGIIFEVNKSKYLINYHTKGYQNNKKVSLSKLDKYFFLLLEFCDNVNENNLEMTSVFSKIACVKVENKINYLVDLYDYEAALNRELSHKYVANKYLRELIVDKEVVMLDARIGIVFTDSYIKSNNVTIDRCGGFIYYSLGNDNLMIYKFKTISLKEIYQVLQELFTDFIPVSLTTDSYFLYDILYKTFDKKIDFILDRTNKYNNFITELSDTLSKNFFTDYKIDAFCLIVENNFNEIVGELDTISEFDFERIKDEISESYSLYSYKNIYSEDDDDLFEMFDDEDEEIVEEHLVDTNLLS